MRKIMTILLLLLLLGSAALIAEDYYVEVKNSTGFDIFFLYVSPEYSDEWEEDVLEDDILADGDTITVYLYDYSTSIFDIQAEDEDGDTYTIFGVDVAYDDLEITLDDLD